MNNVCFSLLPGKWNSRCEILSPHNFVGNTSLSHCFLNFSFEDKKSDANQIFILSQNIFLSLGASGFFSLSLKFRNCMMCLLLPTFLLLCIWWVFFDLKNQIFLQRNSSFYFFDYPPSTPFNSTALSTRWILYL